MRTNTDEKIKQLLEGLPEELRLSVQKKVDFYKSKNAFDDKELVKEIRQWAQLEMLAYVDNRDFLMMYNRKWAEHKLEDYIRKISAKSESGEKDIFTLARLDCDLNGLKAINDLAGHAAGNKALKLFANVIKYGQTTAWLNGFGVEVTVTVEGGDEFGVTIYGDIDLREIIEELKEKYFEEVKATDVSKLIDFSQQDVRRKLGLFKVGKIIPSDFEFQLSASMGHCLFAEALTEVPIADVDATFGQVAGLLISKMFQISDKRSQEHKEQYKQSLRKDNPGLAFLYSRMSQDAVNLREELERKDAEIKKLADKLKSN